MQAFKHLLVAAALALGAAGACAQQHHVHGKKTELGTSAAVDAQGNIWIASKQSDAGGGQYVVLQKSSDMGASWSPPQRIQQAPEPVSADGENRPKLAFGRRNEIYLSYTSPLDKPYTGEIRFVRSLDGGKTFSAPVTVHANRDVITHRFESMIVDREGRIYVAWIDKRDMHAAAARKKKYAGAALYYAVSEDGGASFKGDYKIADHSCECCRIALALDPQGRPMAMWRHVFAPNARDHALVELKPDGRTAEHSRVTFDDWRVDACPHQGPGLAYSANGMRHQVWFNVKGGKGGVFHGAADGSGSLGKVQQLGAAGAAHAEVALRGEEVVLAWKQFDGKSTAILARVSADGGRNWQERELARTAGASDQPRLVSHENGVLLVWRTQNEGVRVVPAGGRRG